MEAIAVEIGEIHWLALQKANPSWHAKMLGGSIVHTNLKGQRRLLRYEDSTGRIRYFRYGSEDK
jgi:hypothetical protein